MRNLGICQPPTWSPEVPGRAEWVGRWVTSLEAETSLAAEGAWAWNQEPRVQILDLLLLGPQRVSRASSLCSTTPGLPQRARGDVSRSFYSE